MTPREIVREEAARLRSALPPDGRVARQYERARPARRTRANAASTGERVVGEDTKNSVAPRRERSLRGGRVFVR